MAEGADDEDFSAPLAADAADDGGSFDLSEALADVLDDGDEDPNETTAGGRPLSTVDDGFESLFSDFKKGVSATLEDGDFETRYDLGIAYREMGLFDDAIGEFQVCLDSPSKRLESLYMMGLCAFEVGRLSDAVSHLEQALSTPDVPEERQVGIRFDLGRAYAAAGDPGRARSAFEALLAITDFPGAAEALADLGDAGSPTLADEEDGFESFDDLITEVEEGAEVVMEAETFENFDDVISEAQSEMLDDEIVDAVPLSEEAEPSEAKLEKKKAKAGSAKPKKKAASKKKAARKKKISFT
jgi:tetratricopeptide (TPR) repeat protein